MPKSFRGGAATGWHSHVRGQVLYATLGLMLAETEAGAWAVPTGHALLIPPGLRHDISMHGKVEMLSAYVAPEAWSSVGGVACQVIKATRLFDAALAALCEEPVLYDLEGRGARLASVVLDEVMRAEIAELALPLPRANRLREVCRKLIENPALPDGLDDWADAIATSRRTFTRTFRKETGMSFSAWKRRLRQLQSLKLREEGVTLKSIASRVGYQSPQALRAMLKRRPI
jgi:AraC-like DNA-binding protein